MPAAREAGGESERAKVTALHRLSALVPDVHPDQRRRVLGRRDRLFMAQMTSESERGG
jgi:hypothetical protein